jgi:hypothetical protein
VLGGQPGSDQFLVEAYGAWKKKVGKK